MKNKLITFIILVLLTANCQMNHKKIINEKTYKLIWQEDFATPINKDIWNLEERDAGWVNNELQAYTSRSENLNIDNNYLIITSLKERYKNANYTSGRLNTQNKLNWEYGYFEIKAKFDLQQGTWPAIWLLSEKITSLGWPKCGEIDIMEHVNNEKKIYGSLHSERYNHMLGNNLGNSFKLDELASEFNIYGLEWTKDFIKWYVNDKPFYTVNKKDFFGYDWPYDGKYFLIINQAIGGDWPGSPLETFDSSKFLIDWIKVYK